MSHKRIIVSAFMMAFCVAAIVLRPNIFLQPDRIEQHAQAAIGDNASTLIVESSIELDQKCFHEMPKDGLCLTQGCNLWYYRASQQYCIDHEQSDALCPCQRKHVAVVEDVQLAAVFMPTTEIATMLAFTRKKRPTLQPIATINDNTSSNGDWALVDSSSSEYSALPCMYGRRVLRHRIPLITSTLQWLLTSEVKQVNLVSEPTHCAACSKSWTCSWLQQQSNHVRVWSTGVYYALDSALTSPGHAVDLLLFGVGQYLVDDLQKDRVPWLVPCSDTWNESSSWIWTRFFVELNAVLNFPVLAMDIRYLDVAHHQLTLRFPRVFFAPYYLGWNQACFRPVVTRVLWPHAEKIGGSSNVSAAHRKISFMKVIIANSSLSSMNSPQRAFLFSLRCFTMMQEHNIVPMSPTLPLLERMWHVNTAEFVMTTWGSAMATTMALLVPQGNRSHRVLVLVHPGYCLEASRLLRCRKKVCTSVTGRGPSRILHGRIRVRDGAVTDFVGGRGFCAKFVVVAALKFVRPHDFTFHCSN